MALAAAFPPHWPALQVYFAISVVLSLIGWTWLARQLRGKVLALREEEFVLAAQLAGASDGRIIVRHLIPSVTGHIIVISTLAATKSGWLRADLIERVRNASGKPVEHIVNDDPAPSPAS